MFGYIVANIDKLTSEEKQRYHGCYCGLCKALGNRHGSVSRTTLNYDMTFLVLFLSSLYQPENAVKTERCMIHPFQPHEYWLNEITDYAADMNVVLTYYKLLDDWKDDKKVLPLLESKLLEQEFKKTAVRYPEKAEAICRYLKELSEIEKSGEINPDLPANCFGNIMSEIFVVKEDEFSGKLRSFGKSLGRFIYIMDACLDLKSDIRKERYNPMTAYSSEDFRSVLNLMMADCTEKYRRLPIDRDRNLIENILYSGVWTRYASENKKRNERQET